PGVADDLEAAGVRQWLRGLARPFQRGDPDVRDVAVLDGVRDLLRHLLPERGEVEAVPAPVEHATGVVHLAVTHQVDDRVGGLAHAWSPSEAAAAARAASGRASSTVWTARSSWAEDRNHASYAEGGRYTLRSSM